MAQELLEVFKLLVARRRRNNFGAVFKRFWWSGALLRQPLVARFATKRCFSLEICVLWDPKSNFFSPAAHNGIKSDFIHHPLVYCASQAVFCNAVSVLLDVREVNNSEFYSV